MALVHGLVWVAPGDPIDMLPNAEQVRPVLAAQWNLDDPLWKRWIATLWGALQGDLGTSLTYRPGMPVTEVIAAPAARSTVWVGLAVLLAMTGGTAAAWWTSSTRTNHTRRAIQVVSIVPVFLLAHLAVRVINETAFAAMDQGWIDRPDWFALPDQPSMFRTALAVAILAVGSGALAQVHQEVEDSLVRIRRSGFIDAARARGARLWPHVLRNLVPPLTTVVALRASFFIGGLVILEKVLLLNGVGATLWRACLERDYPLAAGITILMAAAVALARLIGDVVRLAVDPRLTTGRS